MDIIGYLIAFFLGMLICVIVMKKQEKKSMEKYNLLLCKKDRELDTYYKMTSKYISGKKMKDYFIDNNLNHIAIYGLGRIGKNLVDEIIQSNICLEYVIDREISVTLGEYNGIKCYNNNSILPIVDVIVVTVIDEYLEIAAHIKKKNNLEVISLEEIVKCL